MNLSDLTKGQYLFFAGAFRTIGEGVILGSSGAFFLPETFQLGEPILFSRYFLLLAIGLIILVVGGIIEKRGENDRSK